MARAVQTVQEMYQHFQTGNIPAILAKVASDCRWEEWPNNSAQMAGISWMQARKGPEGAAEFFQELSHFKFHQFDVRGVYGDDFDAVGLVSLKLELPNGNIVTDEEIHHFRLNADGQIIAFRHYLDTAKAIKAVLG